MGYQRIVEFVSARSAPVVIDLMSPSNAIASLFEAANKKDAFGIAVSLRDRRKDLRKKRDQELNIHQLAGDLMKASTWDAIEKELDGRKADLILERAIGGLSCIPDSVGFYAVALNRIWKLLSDQGGVFLGQFKSRILADNKFEQFFQLAKQSNLEICFSPANFYSEFRKIKVVKHPDPPKDLRSLFRSIDNP